MATMKRALGVSLALALVGSVALVLGFALDPRRASFAYLLAFVFATSLAVGSLLLLMLGYAANASWMSAIRRLNEALTVALVPCALLFVPVALCASTLYPWMHPGAADTEDLERVLAHNQPYLNLPSFAARGALYFALWTVPALLLRVWSVKRRRVAGDPLRALRRERALSSAMLLPSCLAATFASVDWLMSLMPTWYSSAFGLYFIAGCGLAAVASVILLAHFGMRAGVLRDVLTPNHFHALGRVLFAFTILWAYLGYFQEFLIFITDEPREVAFFVDRGRGSWRYVGPALAVGHFAIPVLLLAKKAWKFHSGFLAAVSGWLLAMHCADLYYVVVPVAQPTSALPHWLDFAALLGLTGVCATYCVLRQRGLPAVAEHDPLLPQGLAYRSEQ